MVFDLSKKVVSDLEAFVVKEPQSRVKALNFIKREFLYPWKLLCRGVEIFLRDFYKFSLVGFFLFVFFTLVSAELAKNDAEILVGLVYPFFLMIPLLVSMFSAPSSYSFCGVKDSHVKVVVDCLASSKVSSLEQVALVRSNIGLFEQRAKVRIFSLRAFMLLCWTGFVYLYTEVVKASVDSESLPVLGDIMFLSVFFLFVALLYMSIESYSKVNTLLFRSALLGCNEYEFMLTAKGEARGYSRKLAMEGLSE
ncbi:hypothetical protein RSO41_15475 [Halomonas sp. I1]|uniref:hypothetical protein n=1 Tax=Halomonas sp. I1 TaxID=393536 RepID=UPI0028DF3620|nr:hypothetical protein [Halomonas sp. I1]MDT8896049.1 hypothetical protein [Halomonas sp. I1]